jgi:hypothetical protein
LRESPFRQAEGALHGLLEKLSGGIAGSYVVGYGVVMPDVTRLPESAEWDRAVLADFGDLRQFETWLAKFIRHWRARGPCRPEVSADDLRRLQSALRPDFEAVRRMSASAEEVEHRIARLTEDQMVMIDVVEANQRVICSGGAGTGKTMMALELARRWGAAGMKTALACHSAWLKQFLERDPVPGLTVSQVDTLKVAATRAGIDRFDALIVDEGQDVLNMDALDRLDRCLRDGISRGRWCFFHDVNNQSGLCGIYTPDAYDYLASFGPARVPLRTNCRNTLPILNRIQMALRADMGNAGIGDGPPVRERHVSSSLEAARALEQELRDLMDREGFAPGEIAVLSPVPFARSAASALPAGLRNVISVLDDSSPRLMHRKTIGFAGIQDFKGLESPVVLLIDMTDTVSDSETRALQYVGMSRARILLSMIICDCASHA